ncbi:heterokaryon incompatibility protein [Lasiosphaeria ovina]|uniref:Heterokaryon incompatibility protein n=1 Tax=Lasiosphaeria ovina TaxID=92902 RepID=A0AAE0JYI8_9PEZI|nr:heterokaryon incompatibility protein [Lasiosphaeria ovina]
MSANNSDGDLDYATLRIADRQIRLLSILPPSPDDPSGPIRCKMSVRIRPLPTIDQSASTTGPLPPNYISFDHCVTSPPAETHVAELRHFLHPVLEKLAEKQSSFKTRVTNKLFKKALGKDREYVITIPTSTIVNMLTGEEKKRAMTSIPDTPRPGGMTRRVPMSGNHFWESSEDAAGQSTFIGKITSGLVDYVGGMQAAQLNPFFRLPGTSQNANEKGTRIKLLIDDNYVAMSYCWGPPEPTAEIIVNGWVVKVRANLEAGLRQFREMEYFRGGGNIWVDSLCINQTDRAEKVAQVQMMASIYQYAGNILVWLGPEGNRSDDAITLLENTGTDFRAEYVEAFDGSDPVIATTWRTMAHLRMETSYDELKKNLELAQHVMGPSTLDDAAVGLYDFFNRPYWRRLWIIQELCMGRGGMPIVCGSRVTQWRYIRDGLLKIMAVLDTLDERTRETLRDRTPWREQSLGHVVQIAQLEIMGHRREIKHVDDSRLPLIAPTWLEYGPLLGGSLRRAVALASQSECSVSHDRIYGMLNIPGLPDLGIKIDYSKHLADVFTEFSTACVKRGSLDFFALLDGGLMSQTDEHGKPQTKTNKHSWVPDYGAKPERRIGILDGEWYAGGYVPVSFSEIIFSPQGYLVCMGKVLDTIDGTGAMSKADTQSGAMHFNPDNDLPPVRQPTTNDAEVENQNEQRRGEAVIYDVLVGGCDKNGKPAPTSFKCLYTAFPVVEPATNSSFHRNWQFLNSSADFMVHGKPLASYFAHMTAPAQGSDEADATSAAAESAHEMSSPTVTAAARQAMESRTKMRRLILTRSGLLGLAPAQTRPDDAVIAIVGHPKPLIARKDGIVDGQDFWYLIGEAYVTGLMGVEKMPLSTKPWHYEETRRAMDEMDIIPIV